MNVRQSYDLWADRYDTDPNKTRDLEGIALRKSLNDLQFQLCLEIGCGTGKNTGWLSEKADEVVAVDLSEKMIEKAREKITSENTSFHQADITLPWSFTSKQFDLITFSLVLEHVAELEPVFAEATKKLLPGGSIYIAELHPIKQYLGSKARFETADGLHIVSCFNHHISDFTGSAQAAGLRLEKLYEFFDDPERSGVPRIITLVFGKSDI